MIGRTRLKLSLIDDYIFIVNLQKKYGDLLNDKNLDDYEIMITSFVDICNKMITMFEKVFLRLKLMDYSLLLLNRQINDTDVSYFAVKHNHDGDFLGNIKENTQKLKKIIEILPQKLQKLSLNSIEINYILDKSVIA